MTDSRPDQGGEGRAEHDAPAWHSFGVPHGGGPEPAPYTPAMRERPRGELTQPIDTSTTQEVRPEVGSEPVSEPSRPWWATPSHTESADTVSTEPAAGPTYPAPSGEPFASPWAPHHTDPDATGAGVPPAGPHPSHTGALPAGASAERRGRSWVSMAAVALVAALIGGAVVLGGQLLLNRSTSLGSALPAPGPGSTARPDGSIAKIAADALPSVVTIRIKTTDGAGAGRG